MHSIGQAAILALALIFVSACQPVPIPTADDTPVPTSAASRAAPSATVAPLNLPTIISAILPAPATVTPVAPMAVPTLELATPEPGPLPEGGSITVGAVSPADWDINGLPPFLASAVYDSLLRANPSTGALEPGLAEAYQVTDDSLTIMFRLRTGLRFHNGEPVTAEDVVATIDAFSAPDFRGRAITDFGTLIRATAVDSRTVQLVFREPYCPALTSIGTMKIVPRAVARSANFPELKPEQLIGTGPLRVLTSSAEQLILARNEGYYRGAVHIEHWRMKLYPDAAALRSAIASKQIDLMDAAPGDYARLKKIPETKLAASPASQVVMLVFNTDNASLYEPKVREALAHALDRQALLSDIGGQGQVVAGSTLPGFWGNPADLPVTGYNLELTKKLLAEVGWRDTGDGVLRRDNRTMSLELWTEADDPILEPLAFHIREMYAQLGIRVQLQLDDRAGWVTRAFQHRFDLLLTTRTIPLDPDQRWYWQADQNAKGSGFNFGSYANPRLDGIMKDSTRVIACRAEGRATLFGEMQRNLLSDPPAVFLFAPKKYLAAREPVLRLAPSPYAGDYWNLNEWRVRQ